MGGNEERERKETNASRVKEEGVDGTAYIRMLLFS